MAVACSDDDDLVLVLDGFGRGHEAHVFFVVMCGKELPIGTRTEPINNGPGASIEIFLASTRASSEERHIITINN